MNASMSARKSATSFGIVKSMAGYLPRGAVIKVDGGWSYRPG